MKNFIFISPNFPENYWRFCAELRKNGMNVLGIGDCAYDKLLPQLKDSLTEYFKVGSLENYDEVYRAVAFFAYKYGKIDWLESNNEYWLEQDAKLRDDFNIATGFHSADMDRIKYKSKMKAYYREAGIPVARYHMVDDLAGCLGFIQQVGYPVVVKPDNGVGANATYRISSEYELREFLARGLKGYIMEEYVPGEVCSYDAIVDASGTPVFETGNITPNSIMDVVNTHDNSIYYIVKELAPDVRKCGRNTVKSFGVKSRFVHFEFFRLTKDCHLGRKGEVVALEVNMRPCGGYSPDMMNFANSVNVYKIWADMIAFGHVNAQPHGEKCFCAYMGRRDGKNFRMSHEYVMHKYAPNMKMVERIPAALAPAMGDQMYVAVFPTEEELWKFYRDLSE